MPSGISGQPGALRNSCLKGPFDYKDFKDQTRMYEKSIIVDPFHKITLKGKN